MTYISPSTCRAIGDKVMKKIKEIWAQFKRAPYGFQVAWWMVLGGGVITVLQNCNSLN